MKKSFTRILKLSFWVIGGITIVPMSIYILFGSVNAESVIISPIIIHMITIIWFLSIVWDLFFSIKNAKKDLQEFKDKQSIRRKKQVEYLASKKIPSKLARAIAIFSLTAMGLYISYILLSTENFSPRAKTFGWVALFGLVIFFVQLLSKRGGERETAWKKFFYGTGFASEEERREFKRNTIILVVMVALGILAIIFL